MSSKNVSAERDAFAQDGFVFVPQLLPADDFADLHRELDRYIREVAPTLASGDAFYEDKSRPETLKQLHRMSVDPFFREYRRHPAWAELAAALLGEEAEAMEPEWFNKPPGTQHATPPHQDNYYFCMTPPNVVTLWMALDVVDEENGCLRYVAGSHKEPVRPHGRSSVLGFSQGITDYGEADRQREHLVLLTAGDVAAHHGNTIHRADANRSFNRQRRAFAMVFQGVSCRRDEAAYARYQASAQAQRQALALETIA